MEKLKLLCIRKYYKTGTEAGSHPLVVRMWRQTCKVVLGGGDAKENRL